MSNINHGIVAVIKKNKKYFLVKDNRKLMLDYWGPPHGNCEHIDEDEKATVIREVLEGTKLEVMPIKKLWTTKADTKVDTVSFWLSEVVSGEVSVNNNKYSEYGWFRLEEIFQLKLYPGTKKFFNLVEDGEIKI